VWIAREDKVAQAVSLWRAIQSWSWSSDQNPHHNTAEHLQYCYPAIRHLLEDIQQHDREWAGYFDECGVEPYVVSYERLRVALPEVVLGILEYLGLATDRGVAIPPQRRRSQSDDLSRTWVERFREDALRDPGFADVNLVERPAVRAVGEASG
jgi:trehalose 2-sulfotransferase